jgi:23S rRNA pseudouridine955/2504/2580 synthase
MIAARECVAHYGSTCLGRPHSTIPTGFSPLALLSVREGERLDHAVTRLLTRQENGEPIPLSVLHKWARSGVLRVHVAPSGSKIVGEKCLKHRLLAKDMVLLHESVRRIVSTAVPRPPHVPQRSKQHESEPPWMQSCIRWASNDFVVVTKPSGLASQGGAGIAIRSTLDYWLPHINDRVNEQLPTDSSRELRLVHRLDRDVSGLILLARNRAAADAARHALTQRTGILKSYIAFVNCALDVAGRRPASGVLDSSTIVAGKEQRMQTRYHAVPLQGSTVLFLQPITGRKHQLRQHVAELFMQRAAIHGDTLYGRRQSSSSATVGRIYLHAIRVELQMAAFLPKIITDHLPSDFEDILMQNHFSHRHVLQHLDQFHPQPVLF